MKKDSPSLLDMLAKVTAADLAALDEQIAQKEAELEAASKKLVDEIAGLHQLRKVVDIRVNGKPPRKKMERRAKAVSAQKSSSESGSPMVSRILDVLKANGPCTTMTIAKKLGDGNLEHSVRMTIGNNKHKFIRNDDSTWEPVE